MKLLEPRGAVTNLAPYLPGLLSVGNHPMSLADHYPFAPLFSTRLPPRVTLKAGRQVGKSVQVLARLLLQAAFQAYHKTLVVAPLQEHSDMLSSTVLRPLVEASPLRALLAGATMIDSVRRKAFANGSEVYFSYASDDAVRIRGKSARFLFLDELQNFDATLIPVIEQAQSSYRDPVTFEAGTSKTFDTALEISWRSSSQGTWHVTCRVCGFDNRCCVEPDGHLISMIGEARDDVSEDRPGTICHHCRQPVNPRWGRWVHRYPDRLAHHVGFHLPQPIFPVHACEAEKWRTLVGRMNGADNFSEGRFRNEILGEPFDLAYKMLGEEDLRKAASGVGPNTERAAMLAARRYPFVVLGVDWGGGGADSSSRTKVAAVGVAPDQTAEVFFGLAFPPSTDRVEEAREVLRIAQLVGTQVIAHDNNGAGSASESVLTHLGWPVTRIAPLVYRGAIGGPLIEFLPPAGGRVRGQYQLNRARAIQFLCAAVRAARVRFFDYDRIDDARPGLLADFLNAAEELTETPTGGAYRVRKINEHVSDDFLHACVYGLCALWRTTHTWPDLAVAGRVRPEMD
jgi:hypothetical protein